MSPQGVSIHQLQMQLHSLSSAAASRGVKQKVVVVVKIICLVLRYVVVLRLTALILVKH